MAHYYEKSGKSAYTVIGNNGKERSTTIRDARKLGLLPSVTTITGQLDKAGLLRYFLQQIVAATIIEDRQKEGESFEDYVDRLHFAAKKESEEAAKRGSYLHDCLEKYFASEGAYNLKEIEYTAPIIKEVHNITKGRFAPEKSFASQLGYGGKVDLIVYDEKSGIIIDFKSKNTTDKKKFYKYEEHLMQLAAYREGLHLPIARCFDIYFSSIEPGIVEVHEWKEEDLQRGFKQFKCLLEYWQLVNNYQSSFKESEDESKFF